MSDFNTIFEAFYERTKDILVSSDIFRFLKFDEKYKIKTSSLGRLFAELRRQGYLTPIGPTISMMPSRKASKITVYKWTDPTNWMRMLSEQISSFNRIAMENDSE